MPEYVPATITFPWFAHSSTTATTGSWTIGFPWTTTGTYTTTAITTDVWGTWNEWHRPIMVSAEEEQAYQDELQAQREERSRRRLAEMERLQGAQERAMGLLDELVSPGERLLGEELDGNLIEVKGSDGQLYRIELHRRTVHGNILRVDEHGCHLGRACVAPRMHEGNLALPTADGWLGQYLGLKFDAVNFLSHANWSETYRGCQHPDVPILGAA